MKKCPRCNSINSDSEDFCGVCGGSLSGVTSTPLEQLVVKKQETRRGRKLSVSGLALIVTALTMTVVGASLLVLSNVLGVLLFPLGLVVMLYVAGGIQRSEPEQIEDELERRRGEKD